jgi:hypothetical protein
VYQHAAAHPFADLLLLAIAHFTSVPKADVSPDLSGIRPTFGSSSVAPGKWHLSRTDGLVGSQSAQAGGNRNDFLVVLDVVQLQGQSNPGAFLSSSYGQNRAADLCTQPNLVLVRQRHFLHEFCFNDLARLRLLQQEVFFQCDRQNCAYRQWSGRDRGHASRSFCVSR